MRMYERPTRLQLPAGVLFTGVILALAGAIVACTLLAGAV